MQKKEYKTPKMTPVKLAHRVALLQGSAPDYHDSLSFNMNPTEAPKA